MEGGRLLLVYNMSLQVSGFAVYFAIDWTIHYDIPESLSKVSSIPRPIGAFTKDAAPLEDHVYVSNTY